MVSGGNLCISGGLVKSGEHPTLFIWKLITHRINIAYFEENLKVRFLPSVLSIEKRGSFWRGALS